MKYIKIEPRGRASLARPLGKTMGVGIQYGPNPSDTLTLKYDPKRGNIFLQSNTPFRIHAHGSTNIEIITQTDGEWRGDDGIMVPSR